MSRAVYILSDDIDDKGFYILDNDGRRIQVIIKATFLGWGVRDGWSCGIIQMEDKSIHLIDYKEGFRDRPFDLIKNTNFIFSDT